jgi:integrase
MPWQEVPDFIVKLRSTDKARPVVKLLFEFLILTAVRSGEARGACWSEIDLETKLRTLPKAWMKAGKAHVVPMSERALALLDEASRLRTSDAAEVLHGFRGKLAPDELELAFGLEFSGKVGVVLTSTAMPV